METICHSCHGEGCSGCLGVGVLGWEPVQRLSQVYDTNKSFIANLSTHSLNRMCMGLTGEPPKAIKAAQLELARGSRKPVKPISSVPRSKKSSPKEIRASLRKMHPNQIRSIAEGKTNMGERWMQKAQAFLPQPRPHPVALTTLQAHRAPSQGRHSPNPEPAPLMTR